MKLFCDVCATATGEKMHWFPRKEENAMTWATQLKWIEGYTREKAKGKLNKSISICCAHFTNDCYSEKDNKLKYKAIPTILHPKLSSPKESSVAAQEDMDTSMDVFDSGSQLSGSSMAQLSPQKYNPAIRTKVTNSQQEYHPSNCNSQQTTGRGFETDYEKRTRVAAEKRDLSNMRKYSIVDNAQLIHLLAMTPGCLQCRDEGMPRAFKHVGSSLVMTTDCVNCGSWTWNSSSKLHEDNQGSYLEGNVDLVASAYVNGVPYERLSEMCETMSLGMVNRNSQQKIIHGFVHDAVDGIYHDHQMMIRSKILVQDPAPTPLSLVGDAQFDSRGYTATFCRYVVLEYTSRLIVDFEIMMKQETGGNSVAMELACYKKILERIVQDPMIDVLSVTTDKSSSILKYMKTAHPNVCHYLDKWHVLKNFKKNWEKVVNLKRNADLHTLFNHLLIHIWVSIGVANGNETLASELIRSSYYHYQNIHDLPSNEFNLLKKCPHGLIVRDSYLDPNKREHKEQLKVLHEMVTQEGFLHNVKKCAPQETTSPVESFHNIASTIYLSKDIYFNRRATTTQMKLAILHNNEQKLHSQQLVTAGYKPKMRKKWSRSQKRHVEVPIFPRTVLEFKPKILEVVKSSYVTMKTTRNMTRQLGRPVKVPEAKDDQRSDSEESFVSYDSDEFYGSDTEDASEIDSDSDGENGNGTFGACLQVIRKQRMEVTRESLETIVLHMGEHANNYEFFDKQNGQRLIPALLF